MTRRKLFMSFIITMTKLLDADWLRSVQLFHYLYSSTINDFVKTNKMAESHLNTKEIAPEELKALTNKSTKFWFKERI